MAPKLYVCLGSPPASAVRLCAKAIGLELELQEIDLYAMEQLKSEYLEHNIDMLITTSTILTELLRSHKINFKRLCHLVLVEGTRILNRDHQIMDKIWHLIDNMLENRTFSKTVQLIICAEHWNVRLENLVKTLELLPLVCIGNYLKAALYGCEEQ